MGKYWNPTNDNGVTRKTVSGFFNGLSNKLKNAFDSHKTHDISHTASHAASDDKASFLQSVSHHAKNTSFFENTVFYKK